MKKFLSNLFNDNNSINEKSVVGFLAFVMMVLFAIADIVTGYLGKDLVINDFIFNAFLWLVLGSFGIGSVDKWINKSKGESEAESVESNNELIPSKVRGFLFIPLKSIYKKRLWKCSKLSKIDGVRKHQFFFKT